MVAEWLYIGGSHSDARSIIAIHFRSSVCGDKCQCPSCAVVIKICGSEFFESDK